MYTPNLKISISPVWINDIQDCLKFWIYLSLLNHWQVIAKSTQAGFELLMIQTARLVFVKVP